MTDKMYQPEVSFDFSKWGYGDWQKYASSATSLDGPDSVKIAEYLFNQVKVDKRNIATGGASDYEFVIHYPRPNLASSYGEAQWMPILLIQAIMDIAPKDNVLAISGGLDRYRLKPFQAMYGSKIYFLNNKKLALYEKFQYDSAPIEYEVITMQDMESGVCDKKFGMMLAWSQDMENPLVPVDFYIDRLEDKGVLIIQNSSDSLFLYHNHTKATPVWEYHNDIKLRKDCNVYHIPLFYGITIVVKNKI
jgi:hypothetical protein